MKLFGLRVITESAYQDLQRSHVVHRTVINCHRWFSAWKDLDIIWDYILSETYFGDIGSARGKYAKARGTDEYGNRRPSDEP